MQMIDVNGGMGTYPPPPHGYTPPGTILIGRESEYKGAHLRRSVQHGPRRKKKTKATRVLPQKYRPIARQGQSVPRTMDRGAETEKEGTGPGLLSSDENLDRPQAKGQPSGSKRRSTRKRKATEKGAQQDRVRQRKTQARLQKVLLQAPGGYFKPPKRILPKPLGTDSRKTERVQAETGSQEMGPPAHVGGGL